MLHTTVAATVLLVDWATSAEDMYIVNHVCPSSLRMEWTCIHVTVTQAIQVHTVKMTLMNVRCTQTSARMAPPVL